MGFRRRRTFHANLFSIWDHWVVEVPDAARVHMIVIDLADAEAVARDAIATVLGIEPNSFSVVIHE